MLDKLIEYVASAPDAEVPLMTLQDMALCQAWFASFQGTTVERRDFGDVPTIVERWARAVRKPSEETEGRRHQWVLRDLIDELQAGNLGALKRDEIDFLLTVLALAQQVKDVALYSRVRDLLSPFANVMESARAALAPAPALPGLSMRLHVVTTIDIQRAPRRDIKRFAGIALPARGPVLAHKGHLKVLGDVPENCTVVVEDGSCSIEGFVVGRVAATENCEVRENISGAVVVRRGSVRARDIVNQARVVSKGEDVVCRRAQMPSLIFAGREIHLMTGAIMGVFIAPHIRIDGEVYGGVFHVSSHLKAVRFRRSDTRPLHIVLRSALSSNDYGEQPDAHARRLLSQAAKLRLKLAGLADMAHHAEREAERFAKTAVQYLWTTGDRHESLAVLYAIQRRLAVLERLITGYQSLALAAEDRLVFGETTAIEPSDNTEQASSALAVVEEELEYLVNEGGLDSELRESVEELTKANVRLRRPQLAEEQIVTLLQVIRERLATTTALRDEAEETLAEHERTLSQAAELSDTLKQGFAKRSKVQALRSIVKVLSARSDDDPVVERFQSPFMHVLLHNVNRRLSHVRQYRAESQGLAREFATVRDELRRSHQIHVSEYRQAWEPQAQATGVFDEGVRLSVDPHLVNAPNPPRGSVFLTEASAEVKTYYRRMSRIVEAKSLEASR